MKLKDLQFLCQKHGLFEQEYDSPYWSEIRKKDAMVLRMTRLFGFNQNESRNDTDDPSANIDEDENGEN